MVDNFTLDGTTLALSSGNMTLDSAGDISLDAGDGKIRLRDSGTQEFIVDMSVADVTTLRASLSNSDMKFDGNDGGTNITALTLDMSDGGTASFNHDILLSDDSKIRLGSGQDFFIYHTPSLNAIQAATADQDIVFYGNDGGTAITALTLDMSAAGAATFNSDVNIGGNLVIPSSINHTGDTNTFIKFNAADQIQLATGGVERVAFYNSETHFNDSGADVDFIVESDGNANMLMVVIMRLA